MFKINLYRRGSASIAGKIDGDLVAQWIDSSGEQATKQMLETSIAINARGGLGASRRQGNRGQTGKFERKSVREGLRGRAKSDREREKSEQT